MSIKAKCSCTHEAGDSDCAAHPTCPDCGTALDSIRLTAERDALAAKLEEVTREREMLRDNASREWGRLNARLKQAERERNEYHQMLRDILEICGATTRQTIGPDAPLRTVRALVARAEQAERELRTLRAAMPTAEEREGLVLLAKRTRWCRPADGLHGWEAAALTAIDRLTKEKP